MRSACKVVCLCLMPVALTACEDSTPSTQPSNTRERQDAALRDPFGYSPNMDQNHVTGGGTLDFDREGFKRDTNDVLNP